MRSVFFLNARSLYLPPDELLTVNFSYSFFFFFFFLKKNLYYFFCTTLPELCFPVCTPPLLSAMDSVWIVGCVVSVCAWLASAERHSVYWNSTNPKFLWDDYAVEVKLNDYLDIVCPHYPQGEVPLLDAERYVLYMVEREDYDSCKPQSYDQMRWECGHPFAPHAPEKFSEKFQRFTPFTLGKEFRQGESYYYISKPLHHHGQECLRLRVDVVAADGSQEARVAKGGTGGTGGGAGGGGGVHNPSNRLPADDPVVVLPDVQSVRTNSAAAATSLAILSLLVPFSLLLLLH
ncbi:ephrin-A1a isoform X2 [Acanthopagrus latus]|uniref:ephrin-A1a isoform X2 n=1 Tax=Acanthopagrus latus TaxID=8177 RepID=UPI00187BF7B4|nr:ephrin-A1a isoform X2 [Acanthopagrus latus]